MNNKPETTMNAASVAGNTISWLFGMLFLAIGLINTFWGNDPGYGIFIVLLSLVYFPPATAFAKKISGISIPLTAKIILGLFILWSALGVGELFDKIDLMRRDLSYQRASLSTAGKASLACSTGTEIELHDYSCFT